MVYFGLVWLIMSWMGFPAKPSGAVSNIKKNLLFFIEDPRQVDGLMEHLQNTVASAQRQLENIDKELAKNVAPVLLEYIKSNLEKKISLAGPTKRLSMSTQELRRTVIDFEAFKLVNYVTSGVFPKRYFGYFDLKFDTAASTAVCTVVEVCINPHEIQAIIIGIVVDNELFQAIRI